MIRLNPYAKAATKAAHAVEQTRRRQKEELLNKKRGVSSDTLSVWTVTVETWDSPADGLFGFAALCVFRPSFGTVS